MKDQTPYWLREVKSWMTPILPEDKGVVFGDLPVATAASLLKRRLVRKLGNGRMVLTTAGEEFLSPKESP